MRSAIINLSLEFKADNLADSDIRQAIDYYTNIMLKRLHDPSNPAPLSSVKVEEVTIDEFNPNQMEIDFED